MSSLTYANESRIECPSVLPAEAIKISPPGRWAPHVHFGLRLRSATVTSGPPKNMAILEGVTNTSRKKTVTTWRWEDEGDEKWIVCQYGSEAVFMLGIPLKRDVHACSVTNSERAPAPDLVEIRCGPS